MIRKRKKQRQISEVLRLKYQPACAFVAPSATPFGFSTNGRCACRIESKRRVLNEPECQ